MVDPLSDRRTKRAERQTRDNLEQTQRQLQIYRAMFAGIVAIARAGGQGRWSDLFQLTNFGIEWTKLVTYIRVNCAFDQVIGQEFQSIVSDLRSNYENSELGQDLVGPLNNADTWAFGSSSRETAERETRPAKGVKKEDQLK